MKERLQKLMAQANLGSRRACEEFIRAGRVRVNGQVAELGAKADPETDAITVDGAPLVFSSQRKVYYAVYKPLNVLSTNVPHHKDDRPTVRDMLPVEGHLFMVGRLDAESEGLIVLTNDGDLAQQVSHPRYEHTKTYKVVVYGLPSADTLAQWENGVYLEEGKTAPCYVKVIKGDKEQSTLRVVMTEGKKRQIRRVAAVLKHPVKKLARTHIGQLGLGALRLGEWRQLTAADVEAMLKPAEEWREVKQRGKTERKRVSQARPADREEGSSHKTTRNERRPKRDTRKRTPR